MASPVVPVGLRCQFGIGQNNVRGKLPLRNCQSQIDLWSCLSYSGFSVLWRDIMTKATLIFLFVWLVGFCCCLFVLFFIFWDRVSLCSPSCPGTHSIDQAGLELRNSPASASPVLGLKACTITARLCLTVLTFCIHTHTGYYLWFQLQLGYLFIYLFIGKG